MHEEFAFLNTDYKHIWRQDVEKHSDWVIKPVPGFPGYHVDDHGHIYGMYDKLLSPSVDRLGYTRVSVKDAKGRRQTRYLHQLVWRAFNGELPKGKEIHHIDHNPRNNRPENLAAVSHKDNIGFAVKAGRWERVVAAGRDAGRRRSRPIARLDPTGEFAREEYPSLLAAARDINPFGNYYGRASNIVNAMKRGRLAYGFRWEYLDKKTQPENLDKSA